MTNVISYIKWERSISVNDRVIIPSRKFALETLIETYSKINTEKELVEVFKRKLALIESGEEESKEVKA
jgi:hypothetical protein